MPKVSKTQILKLQKQGMTDAAIGDSLGITRQAVHQLRKKLGVKSLTSGNRERNAMIAKAYADGMSGTAIAKKFDLSISQTYRVINASKGKAKRAAKKSVAKAAKKAVAKKAPVKKRAAKKAAAKKVAAKKAPAKKRAAKKRGRR